VSWRRNKSPHRKRKMEDNQSKTYLQQLIEEHKPEYIIGMDEVGWGAIAGPLVIACAVYKSDYKNPKIRDSKTYSSHNARLKAFDLVQDTAVYVAYQEASPGNLAVFGAGPMLQNSYLILAQRAIAHYPNSLVVIDGAHTIKGLEHKQVCLAKADTYVTAVSAASIAAKVSRDRTMIKLGEKYPEYEWFANKGYPTPQHIEAIKKVGVSEHHRRNVETVVELEKKHGIYEERIGREACEEA